MTLHMQSYEKRTWPTGSAKQMLITAIMHACIQQMFMGCILCVRLCSKAGHISVIKTEILY